MLLKLEPMVGIVKNGFSVKGSPVTINQHLAAWSHFALALADFRNGRDASASTWATLCIASPQKNPARAASARIILAMIEQRAGRGPNAAAFLKMDSEMVDERTGAVLAPGGNNDGFWFDWVNAQILLREARGMIEPAR
jgi:hypothetical protein